MRGALGKTQPVHIDPSRPRRPPRRALLRRGSPLAGHVFLAQDNALWLLALLALIVFLRWAQAVLITLTFAVLFSYALTPVVDMLKKHARLPKAVGAALTLALILGGAGAGISSL